MSDKPKWTPGPWQAVHATSGRVRGIDGNGQRVVRWNGIARAVSDEGQANARLIAAAPDLYEALRAIVEGPEEENLYTNGREALKKARGE